MTDEQLMEEVNAAILAVLKTPGVSLRQALRLCKTYRLVPTIIKAKS
jgi:hypothetical protein